MGEGSAPPQPPPRGGLRPPSTPRFFFKPGTHALPLTQDFHYNHYNNNLKNNNNNNNATIVRPLLRLVTITTTATILRKGT